MHSENCKCQRSSPVASPCVAAALFCAFTTVAGFCLNPDHRLSQYGHTAWRVQDGMLPGAPNAIAQTKDGYLWIGTQAGLFRFDGVEFAPFRPSPKEKLRSPSITSLLAARDGSLWIGTAGYLAHLQNGDLTSYLDPRGNISRIRQRQDGSVWISRTRVGSDDRGGLCEVIDLQLHCYGKNDGVVPRLAGGLLEGDANDWWIAASSSLYHWDKGSSTAYSPSGLQSIAGLDGFEALAKASDGSIWAGIRHAGPGLGLQHLEGGKWKPFLTPGFDSNSIAVTALCFDRHHSLWIGTTDAGIYRIAGKTVDHFRAADGLSSDVVSDLYEDREGDIWIATSKGVDKFRDLNVVSYSRSEGLSADHVNSVLAAHDGTVWVGNGVLDSIRDVGMSSQINRRKGLPGRDVTSLLEDKQERLWVGVDDKLFTLTRRQFTEIRRSDNRPIGIVQAMVASPDGTVWVDPIVTPRLLLQIKDNKVVREVPAPSKMEPGALAPDPQGGVWTGLADGDIAHYDGAAWKVVPLHRVANTGRITQFIDAGDGGILGATNIGLLKWKVERSETLGAANGLPCIWIYSAVRDQQKTLWFYSRCGLFSITDGELQRWWEHPETKVKFRMYDIFDGAQPAGVPFQPAASISPDGKLWFANASVLQQIDPRHLSINTVAPPVHIQEIIADKKSYSTQKSLSLPALTRELQINYTATSLVVPQRVKFRYRLEGWDDEWQDAGTRRQAFYTNLRPATYRFHVIACNDDGLWNDAGDVLSFTITRAYYQTRWFQALGVVLFAGTMWVLYLFRLKQATSQIQERLGARMEERERIARELHDTLLQGFQGLMLRFQAVMKVLPSESPAREMMEQVLDKGDDVLLEGRESVRDLRESGAFAGELSKLLTAAATEFAQGTSIAFSCIVAGDSQPLNPVVFNETYRVAREALFNAFQHSQASKIELELAYSKAAFTLRVRDDGAGIDSVTLGAGKKGHWGLSGMRERARKLGAQLDIWSKAGAGTEVELTVPRAVAFPRNEQHSIWHRRTRATARAEE